MAVEVLGKNHKITDINAFYRKIGEKETWTLEVPEKEDFLNILLINQFYHDAIIRLMYACQEGTLEDEVAQVIKDATKGLVVQGMTPQIKLNLDNPEELELYKKTLIEQVKLFLGEPMETEDSFENE